MLYYFGGYFQDEKRPKNVERGCATLEVTVKPIKGREKKSVVLPRFEPGTIGMPGLNHNRYTTGQYM